MAKVKKTKHNPWQHAIGAAVGVATVVAVMAVAFLWPSTTAEPRNVPVAITGSPQQVEMMKKGLEATSGERLELVSVASRDEAVDKIESREAYGALVLDPMNPEVLQASANGPALTAMMTNVASMLQSKLNQEIAAKRAAIVKSGTFIALPQDVVVKTTDIVVAHKATFDVAALMLPLMFGGTIGGAAVGIAVAGRWQRVTALVVYAALAGTFMFLILHTWFDVLPGDFMALAGSLALGILATASLVTAGYVLFGVPGLALAALWTVLVANPLSGLAVPTLFMPEPWGMFGQYLTIGAGGTLLRTALYFPGAEVVMTTVVTLVVWVVAGLAAVAYKDRKTLK